VTLGTERSIILGCAKAIAEVTRTAVFASLATNSTSVSAFGTLYLLEGALWSVVADIRNSSIHIDANLQVVGDCTSFAVVAGLAETGSICCVCSQTIVAGLAIDAVIS